MKVNLLPFHLALFLTTLGSPLLLLGTTPQAKAQNNSDTTGPIMTTSDTVGFGGFRRSRGGLVFRTDRIRDAVYQASASTITQLQAGNFVVNRGGTNVPISASVQQALVNVLTKTGDFQASANQLVSGLANPAPTQTKADLKTPSNLAQGPDRTALAQQLVFSLTGLTANGKVDPAKLRAAVAASNALINASGGDYLSNLPQEYLAIQAVLSTLLNAANSAA